MVGCLENARDGGSKGMGRAGGLKSGGKGRAVRGTRHGWKYRGRIERVSPGWGEWSGGAPRSAREAWTENGFPGSEPGPKCELGSGKPEGREKKG